MKEGVIVSIYWKQSSYGFTLVDSENPERFSFPVLDEKDLVFEAILNMNGFILDDYNHEEFHDYRVAMHDLFLKQERLIKTQVSAELKGSDETHEENVINPRFYDRAHELYNMYYNIDNKKAEIFLDSLKKLHEIALIAVSNDENDELSIYDFNIAMNKNWKIFPAGKTNSRLYSEKELCTVFPHCHYYTPFVHCEKYETIDCTKDHFNIGAKTILLVIRKQDGYDKKLTLLNKDLLDSLTYTERDEVIETVKFHTGAEIKHL